MEDIFDKLQAITGISKYSNSEVITPQNIVKDMVDLLPADVFNPDTKFLDPAVKSGRFLIEIYHRLMNSPLLAHIPESDRQKHIIENQLYGLATSPVAATVTRKALYGNPLVIGNIVYIDRYLILMADKGTDFHKLIEKEFGQMKFDVVIGNPPYQDGTTSIYQYFIDGALDGKNTKICMITKNNWLNSDLMSQTRNRMIKSGLTKIINYPIIGEVFSGVAASVTIFLIDTEKGKTDTEYQEIREGKVISNYCADLSRYPVIMTTKLEKSIAEKVTSTDGDVCFGRNVLGAKHFQINTNGAAGFSSGSPMLNDYEARRSDTDIQIVYMDKSKCPYVRYLSQDELPRGHDILEKYKVVCGRTTSSGDGVITNINVAMPNQVTSASWGVMYSCDSREEAFIVAKYLKTKFVRFLVRIMCSDGVQGLNGYRFSLVPEQDFSHPWTDQMLYKKYGLTQEEIDYIEATIKLMD